MGCFGYICNGCKTAVREGERAVLKHIRHGNVLGEAKGIYDSYGGVEEDGEYRGHHDGINGHMSIFESEFELMDSEGYSAKLYQDKPLKWMEYRKQKVSEGVEDLSEEMYQEWRILPFAPKVNPPRSGTEAWHEYCYNKASELVRNQHRISESDPNQSWGKVRKKYT